MSDPMQRPAASLPAHVGDGDATGLADRLKRATKQLHVEAETTGFINAILRQRGSRAGYVLFLRNLLDVYEALEAGMRRQSDEAGPLRDLARPEIYRADAIRADLDVLHGDGSWRSQVPLLASGAAYAACVRRASDGPGVGLAGHAYTRYLGDLNGGQVLARMLARALELPSSALSFYAFPAIAEPHEYAANYRASIDQLAHAPGVDPAEVEAQALASFRGAIALSNEVAGLCAVAG